MTPATVLQAIALGEAGVTSILQLVASIKAQSGFTDDQLLEEALKQDQATRDRVDAFLQRVNAQG